MTVRELIEFLNGVSPDCEVVISTDLEGNKYRPLYVIRDGYNYGPEDCEIGLRSLTEEDIKAGYSEEDVLVDGTPCVILYPDD